MIQDLQTELNLFQISINIKTINKHFSTIYLGETKIKIINKIIFTNNKFYKISRFTINLNSSSKSIRIIKMIKIYRIFKINSSFKVQYKTLKMLLTNKIYKFHKISKILNRINSKSLMLNKHIILLKKLKMSSYNKLNNKAKLCNKQQLIIENHYQVHKKSKVMLHLVKKLIRSINRFKISNKNKS